MIVNFKSFLIENRGIAYEKQIVLHLKRHGLMQKHTKHSGYTGEGNDFHLVNKKTDEVYEGRAAKSLHQGEIKKNLRAAYGQASLQHTPESGWHFSDKVKQSQPRYTAAFENSTIVHRGQRMNIIDYLNTHHGPPTKENASKDVYSEHTDLHPMHAYLHDHNVDVMHVGTHGTYRGGLSEKKDRGGLGLPVAKGNGRFRLRRRKYSNGEPRKTMTVQFNPTHMEKSHVNLEEEEGITHLKRRLGHL